MTKADLYKRRNKNKQRKSSASEASTSQEAMEDDSGEASLIETINNLKNRMNKNSIENDVELIKANTQDTPVNEASEPNFSEEVDEIPSVKPVEKTYAKARSKLDDYIYIESDQGLDGTEVAFPKGSRGKKSAEPSPVPRKRRKIDTKVKDDSSNANGERELRSRQAKRGRPKKNSPKEKRAKAKTPEVKEKKTRPTKESIENEKTVVTRVTRKRKYEEIAKPVLREKGQNRAKSAEVKAEATRKMARPKRTAKKKLAPLKIETEDSGRMTRARTRRLEISLSPSQVKTVIPAFSFESDRRVNSIESTRSNKSTKGKATKKASKAKKTPVRATRTRATRR